MSDNAVVAASETTAQNGKATITTEDSALKLAHKRLTILQLAESLGNVSQACRRGGLDRSRPWHQKTRRLVVHLTDGDAVVVFEPDYIPRKLPKYCIL